jgi:AbiJ N-terminal domain 4
MRVLDLFSKRRKRLRGEVPEVYQYDKVPQSLRVQIVHIWEDAFGDPDLSYSQTDDVYKQIHDSLAREYGVFRLSKKGNSPRSVLIDFLLNCEEHEKVIDAIELSFKYMSVIRYDSEFHALSTPSMTAEDAVDELNHRFREHGVGYQFESGEIIRVDSEYIHADAVKPALVLLRERQYEGANDEFLKAHEHYRHGRYKESLNECLKSFESTMKAICEQRKWPYNPTDTASRLIDLCFKNGLIPSFLQSEFTSLRTTLESGVPTVRNKLGGHGQGLEQIAVPDWLASYLLHLTATNIILLVEAEKKLP